MINLEELRRGYWVWNDFNKKPEKVEGIYGTQVMLDYNDLYDEDVDSIPLSLELLEDLGFMRSTQVSDTPPYDRDEDENIYLELGKIWGWYKEGIFLIPSCNTVDLINLRTIHELQDFLGLCRIKIEFEFYEQREGVYRIRRTEST